MTAEPGSSVCPLKAFLRNNMRLSIFLSGEIFKGDLNDYLLAYLPSSEPPAIRVDGR